MTKVMDVFGNNGGGKNKWYIILITEFHIIDPSFRLLCYHRLGIQERYNIKDEPNYRNSHIEKKSVHENETTYKKSTHTSSRAEGFNTYKKPEQEKTETRGLNFPFNFNIPEEFEIFGIKLHFDDILLVCLLFFLYSEGVKDEWLFISLILLLLS